MAKSHSQWVNPIFPVHNKASPSSHFTPSRPSMYNSIYETCKLLSANFQHSTFGFAILWLKISVLIPYITPYILSHFVTEKNFIIFQQIYERLYMRFFKVTVFQTVNWHFYIHFFIKLCIFLLMVKPSCGLYNVQLDSNWDQPKSHHCIMSKGLQWSSIWNPFLLKIRQATSLEKSIKKNHHDLQWDATKSLETFNSSLRSLKLFV